MGPGHYEGPYNVILKGSIKNKHSSIAPPILPLTAPSIHPQNSAWCGCQPTICLYLKYLPPFFFRWQPQAFLQLNTSTFVFTIVCHKN